MPFHWCADETLMLLSMLPFIGFFFKKIHAWWHKNSLHKCHEDHCNDVHAEHVLEEKVAPAPIEDWDQVDQTLVEERFGSALIEGLKRCLLYYGLNEVVETESTWFVDSNGAVKVKVRNNEFIHDDHCNADGWDELVGGGRLSKFMQ